MSRERCLGLPPDSSVGSGQTTTRSLVGAPSHAERNHMKHLHRLALVLAAASLPALAQATVPATEDDLKELLELLNTPVQGASKRAQRILDSPQAIEVLTGDEIRQMGIYRLQDALKLMTSVDVVEADNGYSVLGMRGIMQEGQPRTVQVLVDGVPLYSPIGAGIDIANIPVPIDMVEKVEVVRGPSSTLYGANAVAGVIAITTKAPGKGLTGALRASAADKSTYRGGAVFAYGTDNTGITAGYQGYSMGASGHKTHYLGRPGNQRWYLDQPASGDTDDNPWIGSDAGHGYQAFTRVQGAFNDATVWASIGQAEKRYGPEGYFGFRNATRTMLLAGWRQQWTTDFATEVRVHRLDLVNTLGAAPYLAIALEDPGFNAEYDWADQSVTQAEVQANWTINPDLFLVLGADTRRVEAGAAPFVGLSESAKETASGAFAALDWRLSPTWSISLGARVENESLGGSRTSPRAVVVWNPTPSSALRFGYFTSTRSPQILEQRVDLTLFTGQFYPGTTNPLPPNIPVYFQILPNSGLEPEQTKNFEVGYRHAFGPITVDLTAYRMKLTETINQVTLPPTVEAGSFTPPMVPFTYGARMLVPTQFQNAGDATNEGLEVAVTWTIRRGWTAGANMALLDYTKDDVATGDPMGRHFAYTVRRKGNAWIRLTEGRFTFFGAVQAVGGTTAEALSASGTPYFEPRDRYIQFHATAAYDLGRGFSLGAYTRNGAKEFTLQGATGPERQTPYQAMRRETGITASYRF